MDFPIEPKEKKKKNTARQHLDFSLVRPIPA